MHMVRIHDTFVYLGNDNIRLVGEVLRQLVPNRKESLRNSSTAVFVTIKIHERGSGHTTGHLQTTSPQ